MIPAEHLPLADVKNRLSEVVERLEREHGRVIITKHGRPAAALLSVEDLESLEETLETLLRVIEQHSDELICSLLLLDPDGIHLWHGAAPRLPREYTQAKQHSATAIRCRSTRRSLDNPHKPTL